MRDEIYIPHTPVSTKKERLDKIHYLSASSRRSEVPERAMTATVTKRQLSRVQCIGDNRYSNHCLYQATSMQQYYNNINT